MPARTMSGPEIACAASDAHCSKWDCVEPAAAWTQSAKDSVDVLTASQPAVLAARELEHVLLLLFLIVFI